MKINLTQPQKQLLFDNKLTLRSAVDNESGLILDCINRVLEEFNLNTEQKESDGNLQAIASNYHKNGGFLLVVEANADNIIATLAVAIVIPNKQAELRKLYISKSYREMGLGRLLLEITLHWCSQQNLRKISLETASVLKSAIAMYQKFGFVEIPQENITARCDRHFEMLLTSPVNT